ncbi:MULTISPECIES: sugar transferase [Lactobacillus]|uniref:Sugar transferase n=1 Tax=Lactobacillus xujianguonis TaxID=2495899 RepID=A0A437SVI4_9LACO|nr:MULTISPECIES: sugar transferase [Lactobacillus]RVU70935.1 sugar transferase [Lactobacillus xujianguonis]RVU73567.1 sugar transferase [Lactobacillus xujianguonis]
MIDKELNENINTHCVYSFFKRITDVVISSIALIVLSPLILILSIIIFFQDGHNPFYKQVRIGKDGQPFGMFKFRSMVYQADKILQSNPKLYKKYVDNGFKLPEGEDPRITKIGAFIRKTSLDEIPQFLNIILGEMTLVGPRPIIKKEMVEYGNRINEFLSVKPGALGLWQASGRANIGYPERCDIELRYIEHASFWYDTKIFFACCISILKKDGAF